MATVMPLHADNMDSEATADGLLQERIARLEEKYKLMPNISGYVQTEYTYRSSDNYNTFQLSRAHLDIKGSPTKWLDYRFHTALHGTPKIIDVFVNFKPLKQLNIQIGQFKIPLTLENQYSPTVLEFTDNHQSLTYLCNLGNDLAGYSNTGRDIGLMLSGSAIEIGRKNARHDLLRYYAGVFNGAELTKKDDNNYKDFSARIEVYPLWQLALSASCYVGSLSDVVDTAGTVVKKAPARNRLSAGLRWSDERLTCRAEWLRGLTDDLHSQGAYVMATYWITPKWQLCAGFDYYDADSSASDMWSNFYNIGVNFKPLRYLRIQLDYSYRTFGTHRHTANHHVADVLCTIQF